MEEFKSGFVTIIGRTNVGKSTLINLLVGEKVAAIANKVQTTRNAIKGIVNRENSQIVFTDTPGIHKPKHKLNQTMVETSFATIPDSDLILFLIEATSDEIGKGDRIILEKIKESKRKTILIINKIDLVKREKLLNLIDLYSKEYNFEAVIPISAYQPKYKEIILDEIEKNLKPGPAYYDVEEYTDQTMRQLAEETIREKALKLFLSKDINEVNKLTAELNEYNRIRQETEKNIYEEALNLIQKEHIEEKNTIVVAGEGWHHGVIGIVASKITELYFKPSILLCEEDGECKGSGRSIPGFDLHEALMECNDTIDKFGGHAMAVGINIKKEKVEEFKEEFEKIAKEKEVDKIIPILNLDAEIKLDDVNKEMVDSLKELEPFGEANKMPIFAFRNLKIDSIRSLSEGKHLRLSVKDNKNIINAIGFNMGVLADTYRIGDRVDIAGNLEINSFNGVDSIQINIKDIMKSI